jgi:hypothetical protein
MIKERKMRWAGLQSEVEHIQGFDKISRKEITRKA